MYKPSTYLIVTYFPTYLPTYLCVRPTRIGYQGEIKYELSWGSSRVIIGIQWMGGWVLVHCGCTHVGFKIVELCTF
jgi:hypothetical protein